jgi:carboxypeptidase C (cathepsin A)
MGGYVTKFAENFHFLTIRGSGHMVPEFKPAAALSFLNYWLKGKPFPAYNPPHARQGSQKEKL